MRKEVRRCVRSLLIAASCLVIVSACSKPPARPAPPAPRATVTTATDLDTVVADVIADLLDCSTAKRDCFVDITERSSEIIFQISADTETPVYLNVPTVRLRDEQIEALAAIMKNIETSERGDHYYMAHFGRDADAATRGITVILREVFGFTDGDEFTIVYH